MTFSKYLIFFTQNVKSTAGSAAMEYNWYGSFPRLFLLLHFKIKAVEFLYKKKKKKAFCSYL